MTTDRALIAIIIISAVTISVRFAPFLLFERRKTPQWITYLGRVLPYAVMGMLVVYCLKGIRFTSVNGFLPELIAGAIVAISYAMKRNTLISIVGGTLCYMLLVQLIFV